MAIQAGEDTFYQAKRGIVQDGLLLNFDTMVGENTSSSWQNLKGGTNVTMSNFGGYTKTNTGLIIDLDAADDKGEIADSSDDFLFSSSAFSVCAWANVASVSQGGYTKIIGKPAHSNTMAGAVWSLQVVGTGSGGSLPQLAFAGATVDTGNFTYGTWIYCVGTVSGGSGGTTKVYQNASLKKTATTSFATQQQAGRPLIFGASSGWGGSNFSLACLHIYNKELTAAEVLQNYNATRHRFGV